MVMAKRKKMSPMTYNISEFYCTVCGNKGIPLPRSYSSQRNKSHLKKLYCTHCRKETNHVEIRSCSCDYNKEEILEQIKKESV